MTNSLRILQVLRAPIGGLYRHVVDLSTELAARGHQLGLVMDSSVSDIHTVKKLAELEPQLALGLHKMPIPRLFGAADALTPFRLKKLANELDIDVLHGHGAKGGFHARLSRIGTQKRVAVYTPHGGVLNFDPKSISGRIFMGIEAALLHQTDAIAFESSHAKTTYIALVKEPNCLTRIVHNGLAQNEFVPVPPEKNAYDFAFVGELRDLKGIFFLLEALARINASGKNSASLIVAGNGPARTEVTQKITQLALTDHVEMVGVQPARAVFARGRCVVVPSLAESLPYVVLEAAAAAKPIIATNVGGISEIFGPTGASLIKPADTAALQTAMQIFLDDEIAALDEMKLRRTFVQAGFSIRRMTDGIENMYRETISRR